MYGPPALPATGGGWLTLSAAGLLLGNAIDNVIIIGVSIALIILISINFIRLRRGEKIIAQRDST